MQITRWRFIVATLAGLLLSIVSCLWYATYCLPSAATLLDTKMQVPMRIYTADGALIAEYGAKHRLPIGYDDIPLLMKKAIIAAEDHRFYQHHGVDFISLMRAVKELVVTGKKSQGASTITMQVARNFFLSTEKTYSRKIDEILLSFKIELLLTKAQILELYLNKIFLGHRAYGVKAAARSYYGKDLDQLSLAQFAMLAGLPKAPSSNNPITNPEKAIIRRNYVLTNMLELHYIDKAAFDQAIEEPITESFHGARITVLAPHAAEMVRQDLVHVFGKDAYTIGLQVYTTLESQMQNQAVDSITTGVLAYDKRHGYRVSSQTLSGDKTQWPSELQHAKTIRRQIPAGVTAVTPERIMLTLVSGDSLILEKSQFQWAIRYKENGTRSYPERDIQALIKPKDIVYIEHTQAGWQLSQNPLADGALVSIDPQTGAILALNGGYHFYESNFNRVTQAKRQSGSLFKPFLYSAALDKGFTLSSIINDAPVVVKDSGDNEYWRPNNVNYTFSGPTRVRVALAKSRNLVSVRLLDSIGIAEAQRYIGNFGFVGEEEMPTALSLALGSGISTPLQNTAAYATFANGGHRVRPYLIDRIIGQDGQPIAIPGSKYSYHNAGQPIITEKNAYLISSVLGDVIKKGTGRRALSLGRKHLFGKTGTTNDQKDAWFCGFTDKVVTTVWVGFDNAASLHEYAAQLALPIWIDYMRPILSTQQDTPLPQPEGIVTARVNRDTGLITTADDHNSFFEYFDNQHIPEHAVTRPLITTESPSNSLAGLYE